MSSLRQLMCPAQYHLIFLTVLIMSTTFIFSLTQMLVVLSLYVMLLSILLSMLVCDAARLFLPIGVRGNIHWGGADRVLPEWIRWGGVVADIFRGIHIHWGGGVVAEIVRDPYSGGGGSSRDFPRPIRWGGGGGCSGRIVSVNRSNRP